MTKHNIFENCSLTAIFNAINHGAIGVEEDDIKNLIITSNIHSDIFIKLCEFDITELIPNIVYSSGLDTILHDDEFCAETEFISAVVFTVDQKEKTLMNMSLFEYINIHENPLDFQNLPDWNLTLLIKK